MKTSELIQKLQTALGEAGDNDIVFAANRHSYLDAQGVNKPGQTVLALFDKLAD